jgi:chitinase
MRCNSLTVVLHFLMAMPSAAFRVVGYLPDYRVNSHPSYKGVTDLILFSVEPDSAGNLQGLGRMPSATRLKELKGSAERVLLGLGGWGRCAGFEAMVRRPTAAPLKKLVGNIVWLVSSMNLQGVDFDVEVPGLNPWPFISKLVTLLRRALMKVGRSVVITAPFHPGEVASIAAEGQQLGVDLFHAMAYDNFGAVGGQHSTFELAEEVISAWERAGLELSRLTLGLPFYGRNVKNFHDAKAFYEAEGASNHFFNGPALIKKKVRLARNRGLAGVMIWELGQDDRDQSLLRAVLGDGRDDL